MEIRKDKRVIGTVTLVIRKPVNGYITIDGQQKRISKIVLTSSNNNN